MSENFRKKLIALSTLYTFTAGIFFIANQNTIPAVFLSKNSLISMNNETNLSVAKSLTPHECRACGKVHRRKIDVNIMNKQSFDPQ